MARLYDRVMAGQIRPPVWTSLGFTDGGWDALRRCPVIVADNVARYYYEDCDKDEWSITEDFPNIAPPWESFWVEFRSPSFINRGGDREQPWRLSKAVGFLIASERRPEGWLINAQIVSHLGGGMGVAGPLGTVCMMVDPQGRHIDDGPLMAEGGRGIRVALVDLPNMEKCFGHEAATATRAIVQSAIECVKPVLLAISFMHCKNVERREVAPPKPLDKKWQKKGNKPLVRYHVLDIDPMRKVLRDEGGSEETGLKKALHICRGHFAHYPDGLFGRGTPETVWKTQHVRGSAKQGAVVKDYNVKAPKSR